MNAVDQVQLNFDPATLTLLNILIGLIMFGVALDIRVDDFKRVVRDPRGPLIAAWWGVWHLISGLTVATYWSRRPVPKPEAA